MRRLALLSMALCAAAPSARADEAALRKAWRTLVASTAPPARAVAADAVLAACGQDAQALLKCLRSETDFPAMAPGWHKRTTTVQDGAKTLAVEFHIRLPRGYAPSTPWPAVLLAHGQGGDGRHIGATFARLAGGEVEKFVLVAPTMPGARAGFNARAYQEDSYLKPLAWAKANLNLDDERIYLTGYSQGGHVSWHLAALFPHHFAAAAPVAGAPIFEGYPATTTAYLENLANLPTWALWGERDGAPAPAMGNVDLCRQADRRLRQLALPGYRGTELPGRGHSGCWPAGAELLAFFRSHRRQAAPEKLTHAFHLPAHRRAYYLEAVRLARPPIDFSKGVRVAVPAGARPDKDTVARLLQQHAAKSLFRIQATREPKANTLRIRTVGVRTLRVYLLDGLLDLHRPVVIHHAGRTWKGKIPASARCVLTHYLATRDASAPVRNELDLEDGKVTVRFAEGAH